MRLVRVSQPTFPRKNQVEYRPHKSVETFLAARECTSLSGIRLNVLKDEILPQADDLYRAMEELAKS